MREFDGQNPFKLFNAGTDKMNLPLGSFELRPTELHYKEDGAIGNKPSFCILMEHPDRPPVYGQVSMEMFNKALKGLDLVIHETAEIGKVSDELQKVSAENDNRFLEIEALTENVKELKTYSEKLESYVTHIPECNGLTGECTCELNF